MWRPASLLSLLLVSACGDGEDGTTRPTPAPGVVTVSFEYRAPTAIDAVIAAALPACVRGVGQTHIHPSWQDFRRVDMSAAGDMLWIISFGDVPTGRNSVRVSDPNECSEHTTAAVTALAVFANGTLLTQIVDTPGTGIEPGFGFGVDASGRVTP